VIVDSAASNVFKRVTYTNIKAFLKTYFDTLYAATGTVIEHDHSDAANGGDLAGSALAVPIHDATGKTTPVDADELALIDSADSNSLKKLTWANLKATLKTYFDTIYGRLSGGNTWTGTQVIQADGVANVNELKTYRNNTSQNHLRFDGARGSLALPLVSQDQDAVGRISGRGYSAAAAAFVELASIIFRVDGTPDSGGDTTDMPGVIEFWTTPEGAGAIEQAAEISNDKALTLLGNLIANQIIRARTSSGLQLQDDGGNIGLVIADGGNIGTGGITDPQQSLEVSGPDAASTSMRLTSHGTALNTSLSIYTPRGTRASPSANLAGDKLGLVTFGGFDTNISNSAQIRAEAAADFGSGGDSSDSPGNLIFATTPDGSGTLTDRMIITSAGLVIIGALTSVGASLLGIQAGSSSNDAAVGGVLDINTATVGNATLGNVGGGEDIIATYTIPANTLAVNGQSVWFEAWGVFNGSSTDVATILVELNGQTILSKQAATNDSAWVLRGRIIRTGATSQQSWAWTDFGFGGSATASEALTQTLSNNLDLTISAISVPALTDHVVCDGFLVGWDDANS
jgi:hypothetical protein